MNADISDRHSLFLLLALLLLISLTPFLGTHRAGEVILIISLYATLTAAILTMQGKRALQRIAIIVAVPVVLIEIAGFFYPSHALMILDFSLLIAFFGFVSVGLFTFLGKPGTITSGRIYASASLYLMLATFWFALYNLTEEIYPGSFAQTGVVPAAMVHRSGFLYFSLITLTTVGYGDIVPVSPVARVITALEGVTGVLYIAITVARLVAAYQRA
jgi:hypothetical protein